MDGIKNVIGVSNDASKEKERRVSKKKKKKKHLKF